MEISYDIGIKIEGKVRTFRFPLGTIIWRLLHVPSDSALDGIVVNALNSIAREPVGGVAVMEICNFFAELFHRDLQGQASNIHGAESIYLEPYCQASNIHGTELFFRKLHWQGSVIHGARVNLSLQIQASAVLQLPIIPGDVPLSRGNLYNYFRDCGHEQILTDRWKATKAEYLAQNPHMAGLEGEARGLYEIRRQMAHELGWVNKDMFYLFETPPGISEEFRPVISRPPWNMPFMSNPGMELPTLPHFSERRATPALSPPRSASL